MPARRATSSGRATRMGLPHWAQVLRALRETRGVTRETWADLLGYGRSTVWRWESGIAVPDATAEVALIARCQELGLFHRFHQRPLHAVTLTPEWLSALLVEARLGAKEDGTSVAAHSAGPLVPAPGVHRLARTLPVPLTSFIGREQELAEVGHLLTTSRLLTLTGAGGSGKTRLAIEAVRRVQSAFSDGVWFVDLAPLPNVTLVPAAIARALGVRESQDWPLTELLQTFLRNKTLLLVLDNFEHLTAAAPLLDALLTAAPQLTLLVTSRAVLPVPGEREYPLTPLPLPAPEEQSVAVLAQNPAVALFVLRAQDVQPHFALSEANATAVAAICRRLDGLPLAIELAAGRTRVLTPQALLTRLNLGLPLSTGGSGLPARQRTLRATIRWSYDLLSIEERILLRRLAVFNGGCTIDAAEAVCAGQDTANGDILEGIASLVEQSLLQRVESVDAEPRFVLLQTIREFVLAEQPAGADLDATCRRHRDYFLALATRAARGLRTVDHLILVAELEAERENLRSALAWSIENSPIEFAQRMTVDLYGFWASRGYEREGWEWSRRVLATTPTQPTAVWAETLRVAARLARTLYDAAGARVLLDQSVGIWRELGDARGLATALVWRALGLRLSDRAAAQADIAEAFAVWPFAEESLERADALHYRAHVEQAVGKMDEAEQLYVESVSLLRTAGDHWNLGQVLMDLGKLASDRGDYIAAGRLLDEGLVMLVALGDETYAHAARVGLGLLALRTDDSTGARRWFIEALRRCLATGLAPRATTALYGLAAAAALHGDGHAATRLVGAVARYEQDLHVTAGLEEHPEVRRRAMEAGRASLEESAYREALAAGERLNWDELVTLALRYG